MSTTFNIYCDESCHLEHDGQKAMVLGAVWCPVDSTREATLRLREIKAKHRVAATFEVKWTKVSPSKVDLYLDLIDYFFDNDDLHFRALIIPDKDLLNHGSFDGQSHDEWYYKMYFNLLKTLLGPFDRYRIYIDIKDTRGAAKVRKLHDILCSNLHDFEREILERVQQVRSHEVELLQIADLLIGAVSYANRGLGGSAAKMALIERIHKRSRYQLTRSTLFREQKLNLFRWQGRGAAA